MPVYFVIYQDVRNRERFEAYVKAVSPVIERQGARLVAQGVPELLEGGRVPWRRAVIFLWPSRDVLLRFYRSAEYGEIKKLRAGAALWQAICVEGLSAAP